MMINVRFTSFALAFNNLLIRIMSSLLAGIIFAPLAHSAEKLSISVSHDLAIARPSETITVAWSEVNQALPGALIQKLVVRDAKGQVLPYQVTNLAPLAKDPKNSGVAYGELIFQYDFVAGEKLPGSVSKNRHRHIAISDQSNGATGTGTTR